MPDTQKEHSAGGVVLEDGRVLAIRVRNLLGNEVWTFPKGHLEPGETAGQAALREVAEETGWACEIIRPLHTAHYSFLRSGRQVEKDVSWFLMRRAGGDGKPTTPDEVLEIRWLLLSAAERLMTYRSDIEILALLR